jgi:hypothetical protein
VGIARERGRGGGGAQGEGDRRGRGRLGGVSVFQMGYCTLLHCQIPLAAERSRQASLRLTLRTFLGARIKLGEPYACIRNCCQRWFV